MRAGEIRALADQAGIAPGVSVLDLCCGIAGPGRFITRELGCAYLGVDLSSSALGIARWFREVHGAPTAKADAIPATLAHTRCRREDALFIGDSLADHDAAQRTGVDFLLRRTVLNRALQEVYAGPQCEDFRDCAR